MATVASPTPRKWSDDAQVVQSIALLVLLSLLLLATVSLWTSHRANDLAVGREIRLAQNAVEHEQNVQAQAVRDVAVSDETYRSLHLRADADAIASTLSRRFALKAGQDVALFLRGDTAVAYAGDRRLNDHQTHMLMMDLAPVMQDLLASAYVRPPARNALLRPPASRQDLSIWTRVEGRPALVTAAVVRPDTLTVLRPGPASLIATVTSLGPAVLNDLAHSFVLPELAFVPAPRNGAFVASGSAVLELHDRNGDTLGALTWVPSLPGQWMLRNLVPPTLAASAFVVVFAMFVVRRFRKRVQEMASSEAAAKSASLHDGLSGLANRLNFHQNLDAALAAVRLDPARGFSVVYVDLDRFKDINDTLGHQAGDEVICQTALRLAETVGPGDLAARIAGDEFALLIRSATDRTALETLLKRLVEAIGQPIPFGERTIYPGGSLGCATAPHDGTDRAELLHRADLALYRAKAAGRGRWLIFSVDMDDGHRKRQAMRQDLRSALAENRLTMLYQPFFAVEGMTVAGVEARVAWDHPIRGRISAGEFIPVAEESGMIRDLGAWVLRRACRDAAAWPGIQLAINVSPSEMRHPNFAEDLLRVLEEEDFAPGRLQVDLTENILLADADMAIAVIERLRSAGVRIALDEFGSGQSSFNYLSRFRFDMLKIDRSVIARLETSNEVATIIQTTVDLAKKLGLRTAAEGVETFGQFRFIQSLGCDTVQGHLCARPMPPTDVSAFIARPDGDRLRVVA